ncbi:MAG: response regulator [Pirellulales bacterium]
MPHTTPHILVVDDERDICENLRDILEEFGYSVDVAGTGEAALELLQTRAYDVALLDLKMPGMTGVEVCRRIRDRRTGTVGLILTAYASPQAARDAVQAGAWRVLSKPIDTPQLMEIIENLLRQPLVMVVDDDQDLCSSLQDMFREQGYRVCAAHTPEQVQQHLEFAAPHVVLIDLKLAEWDGLQVFEQVRERSPNARTILITAHRDEMAQRINVALERGAISVCYKPFDLTSLLAQIRSSLPDATRH